MTLKFEPITGAHERRNISCVTFVSMLASLTHHWSTNKLGMICEVLGGCISDSLSCVQTGKWTHDLESKKGL